MKLQKGLSQEWLKIIACVTMLIDHFGILVHYNIWLRVIGRLAFPIYCFLISEGIRHTRDPKKYFGRLLLMALVTEPVYDLVLYPYDGLWAHQNVLWTLALGAVMLECIRRAANQPWRYLIVIPFALAAECIHCSYGGAGVLMIALFGLVRDIPWQKAAWLVGLLWINGILPSVGVEVFGLNISVQLFATFALVPIFLYSGEKRTKSKALSWAFYLFYPVHLLVLYGIRQLMIALA